MEEEDGLFGLDDTTVSLICGLSVLFVVLIIITLGIIGFFIKVRFIHCQVDIDKLMAKIKEGSTFVPDFYPTPGIALFVGWSVTKFAASSALAHSTNDEYQESAVLFEPLYTRPERPKGAKDEVN